MRKLLSRIPRVSAALLLAATAAWAAVVPDEPGRFDGKVLYEPTAYLGQVGETPDRISGFAAKAAGWNEFRAKSGGTWDVRIDRRSGTPLLVSGSGIRWFDPEATPGSVDALEAIALRFVKENEALLNVRASELVFDREGTGAPAGGDRHTILFRREVDGIPVEGQRLMLFVVRGNLVAFGSDRWGAIDRVPAPVFGVETTRDLLHTYMGLHRGDEVEEIESGVLVLSPYPPTKTEGAWEGPVGEGITHRLARRFVLRVTGERGTWVAKVDAVTGEVFALYDDDRYAHARGWVYPKAADQNCGAFGCLLRDYPMPFASLVVNGAPQTSNDAGIFNCSGGTASTQLQGPYVRINDACGTVLQTVACDANLDLAGAAGTNCTVPGGSSAGNTNAARSGFWIINRIKEKARYWLPANTWLQGQVQVNTNVNSTCNASWNGQLNMYRAGNGCRNTAETAGVLNHEFGHGLDQNDGGGYDNSSEAYADVIAILSDRASCIGRGFREASNCSAYGDTCLSCTGIREHDFAKRVSNTPATPSNFTQLRCGSGSGPCGRQVHCESYVPAGALYDLAARDLPATGMDQVSAWQLAERLFYKSRQGSGGPIFNCALPNADGCNAGGWFNTLRVADDDDGNLANGTPHAAAIYAAFARHGIACGSASDASNQSTSSCPVLVAPTVTTASASASIDVSWTAVPNATSYMIMRSDIACSETMNVIADVAAPTTQYADTEIPNAIPLHYRVQARTANTACESPVSACASASAQAFAGTVRLDRRTYGCGAGIQISTIDANVGASTTTVTVSSRRESAPETVVLTQAAPGSDTFVGTIATTVGAAVSGDGTLAVAHDDVITVRYVDASDGAGGVDVPRTATATIDCLPPVIRDVTVSDVTGVSARISWTTDEPAGSVVRFGTAPPPSSSVSSATLKTSHALDVKNLAQCSLYSFSVESADAVPNLAVDTKGGSYYTFRTGRDVVITSISSDTPLGIPDNNATGATSTINVSDTRQVVDVRVRVTITHSWDGDIALKLIAPNGVTVDLATNRGGQGDNYNGTTFDDTAATSVAAGIPPFSGAFRPETPLAASAGIPAAGAWKLKVVDNGASDVGTIEGWRLYLRFPAPACGAGARVAGSTRLTDTCAAGGTGAQNGAWDAGETVAFAVALENNGEVGLTNVSATLVPTTPGVTMLTPSASFPAIASTGTAGSNAPHFEAAISPSLACGSSVGFDVQVTSDQGSFTTTIPLQTIGVAVPVADVALDESFGGGIPPAWTVVDGGVGLGPAATWTADDPGTRPTAAPISAPVAIADSDAAGPLATQDEQLISPVLDLSAASDVTLEFDQYFRSFAVEKGDVDVRSTLTGGAWVNVLRNEAGSSPNPDRRSLDITAQAAGASDVQVRFRYYDAGYGWYWQIDNVRVLYSGTGTCSMDRCGSVPAPPPPVPDGTFGSPLLAARSTPEGAQIALTWDAASCTAGNYHVLYGPLAQVSSYEVSGARCDLGTAGSATWSDVPAGSLWFVIVSNDGAATEGSWGRSSAGAERNGATPSALCALAARSNAGTCP